MIRINYEGLEKNIMTAVNSVNSIFKSAYFYNAIKEKTRFDMANIPAAWIADLIESADLDINIDCHYSLHPFSKTIACELPEKENTISINKWNINKSQGAICNAIMHQCIHVVNKLTPQYDFGHGDGNLEGKENTAPIWIADLAERIATNKNINLEVKEAEEICDYSSLTSVLLQVKLSNATWLQTYR